MKTCPFCDGEITPGATKCRHCGELLVGDAASWQAYYRRLLAMPPEARKLAASKIHRHGQEILLKMTAGASVHEALKQSKSNGLAFLLGVLLGPVGLWYKGCWLAGFAWLAIGLVVGLLVPLGFMLAPVFWIGQAVHAAFATPRP